MAMPVYAIATIAFIRRLTESVFKVWYANDANTLGSIAELCNWWNKFANLGLCYGYYANPNNTWLVMKESCLSDAVAVFTGTNVHVTSSGPPRLGVTFGHPDHINYFLCEKILSGSMN